MCSYGCEVGDVGLWWLVGIDDGAEGGQQVAAQCFVPGRVCGGSGGRDSDLQRHLGEDAAKDMLCLSHGKVQAKFGRDEAPWNQGSWEKG